MKIAFTILLSCEFLNHSINGFAFQLPLRPNTQLHGARPEKDQQEIQHLYIPDDEEVLMNGRQELNGVSESRTTKGAKIYLPDDYVETKQPQPQTTRTTSDGTGHIYAGIPDEDLLIQESDEFEAFKYMNSNTHPQVADKTTAGKKRKTGTGSKPVALKHLFRYFTDICVDCWLSTVDPVDFLLSCNYTKSDIAEMEKAFPRLTSLDVKAHLSPHVRFIARTLGAGEGDICDGSECAIGEEFIPHNLKVSELGKTAVPPVFFGRRLEKSIVPRHAYLVHYGVAPHGKQLLSGNFEEFLEACDNPSKFAHLCNQWSLAGKGVSPFSPLMIHTAETVEAFERAFNQGLLPSAQNKYTQDLDLVGCSPGRMVDLLLQHGANAIEHDRLGNSILHWAAGSGNVNAAKALLTYLVDAGEGEDAAEVLINTQGAKDGATPIHWASCGIKSGGGHANIVRLFLDQAGDRATELVDIECYSGSTPLMWAVWAGSLDVVKLLVSRGAHPHKKNRSDTGVAHFAAAGGNLEMCRYLHDELGVSFDEEDSEGNKPLNHAESSRHQDVVEWLLLSDRAR